MGGVQHQRVDARAPPAPRARSFAWSPTPTAAPTRSRPFSSFAASGYCRAFLMSLMVIRPLQLKLVVHQRQLFDAVLVQNAASPPPASCRPAPVIKLSFVMTLPIGWSKFVLKHQVPVGQNADEPPVLVGDGHARDAIAGHDVQRVLHTVLRDKEIGIDDDAAFRPLHLVHFAGLRLDVKLR